MISSRPVRIALGLSVCGISCYLVYKYLKKYDEDYYEDTVVKAQNFKVLEMKVPKEMVRELIGRNGKNIKNIQELSGTKINFKNNTEKDVRKCVIRGSIEACHNAETLILEFIDNQPVIECAEMLIPRSAVGRIIGRCGDNIIEMQCNSGAKIIVDREQDSSISEVKVEIKGTKEQIIIAESLINHTIQKMNLDSSKLAISLSKREPRAPAKLKNKSVENASDQDRLSPTFSQESPFEVYVSAIIDPSRFWIQIVGPKATELDQLVEEMTEYYNKKENQDAHSLDNISKGDLVAAIFQYDKKWYRAEVLETSIENEETKATLYYVDYGDTDTVSTSKVYELRTDFLQLHFQAIECYLANIEPVEGEWSNDAVDNFEELTHVAQWKKLSAKINGYFAKDKMRAVSREGSPVPGLDLYDCNSEKDINIAEELVNRGFAIFKNGTHKNSSNC